MEFRAAFAKDEFAALQQAKTRRVLAHLNASAQNICNLYVLVPVARLEGSFDPSTAAALFTLRVGRATATEADASALLDDFCVKMLRCDAQYKDTVLELQRQIRAQLAGESFLSAPRAVRYTAEQTRQLMRQSELRRLLAAENALGRRKSPRVQNSAFIESDCGQTRVQLSKARAQHADRLQTRLLALTRTQSVLSRRNERFQCVFGSLSPQKSVEQAHFEPVRPLRRVPSLPELGALQEIASPRSPPRVRPATPPPPPSKYEALAEKLNAIADKMFQIETFYSRAQQHARNRRLALELVAALRIRDEITGSDCAQLAQVIKNDAVAIRLKQCAAAHYVTRSRLLDAVCAE